MRMVEFSDDRLSGSLDRNEGVPSMVALSSWLRTDQGRTRLRYVAVSAISVGLGELVLVVCFGFARWSVLVSNFAAFLVSTCASFSLQRRWTWGRGGRARFSREIVPFWIIAVVGLGASSLAVRAADAAAGDLSDSRLGRTAFVVAASLGAYGLLWIWKFIIFDRYLFGNGRAPAAARRP